MKLCIVGSVQLWGSKEASDLICKEIERLSPKVIVSGGATGIDLMAEYIGKYVYGLETEIYRPTVERWEDGYKPRNLKMALCLKPGRDSLLRIIAKTSKTYGSGWTRDRAKMFGVNCLEYVI